MQLDKKYRIEKAVSTETSRENLQNIWITRHHAFATDGHILAAVPITTEKVDTEGWLTTDALKLARKAKGTDTLSIELNGCQKLSDGTMLIRPTENKFPAIQGILMGAFRSRAFRIAFNASYLKDLADALGTEEIILEISKPDEAILVRPKETGRRERGLLMPIRIKQ